MIVIESGVDDSEKNGKNSLLDIVGVLDTVDGGAPVRTDLERMWLTLLADRGASGAQLTPGRPLYRRLGSVGSRAATSAYVMFVSKIMYDPIYSA
jgi:hypothetical protein